MQSTKTRSNKERVEGLNDAFGTGCQREFDQQENQQRRLIRLAAAEPVDGHISQTEALNSSLGLLGRAGSDIRAATEEKRWQSFGCDSHCADRGPCSDAFRPSPQVHQFPNIHGASEQAWTQARAGQRGPVGISKNGVVQRKRRRPETAWHWCAVNIPEALCDTNLNDYA